MAAKRKSGVCFVQNPIASMGEANPLTMACRADFPADATPKRASFIHEQKG